MRNYGLARLSEFLNDRVVYRSLTPADNRLPGLPEVGALVGLAKGRIPRKSEYEYALVVARILIAARRQDVLDRPIERLIFVGDTRLLDGSAYANLLRAGGWPGLAFIASETGAPPALEDAEAVPGAPLFLANRWSLLPEFDRRCAEHGLPIDAGAAVVVDLDKTALGARGRNGQVIDAARVQAVQDTVADLLGESFDPVAFRAIYDPLNQPEFHPFTGDNQDYLAYICLLIGGGMVSFDRLTEAVRSGRMKTFDQFITEIDARRAELPPRLASIHADIHAGFSRGDPTPFKAFRRREYLATIGRFGLLAEDAAPDLLLREEILITQEVREMALEWRRRGALLFGLSDKPDEAALPTDAQAAQGYLPLHRAPTHAVGV